MKSILTVLVVIALLAVGVAALFAMTSSTESVATGGGAVRSAGASGGFTLEKIMPEEAHRRWRADPAHVVLLDVRTPEEYEKWNIPGALHIPGESPNFVRMAEEKIPDKNAEIFLFCRTGRRAVPAAEQLAADGYARLRNMGGIIDWPFETTGSEVRAE